MRQLQLTGATGESTIVVGESLDRLPTYIDVSKTVIITDGPVKRLYGAAFPPCPVIEIGEGEESKTLETVENIYDFFLGRSIDRSSFVVAIGGGIVCDVAGFAASTYMRGVRFGFVATTLLAQVDASVGGKNGVNLHGYKNLVGVFSQPNFVICDQELLRTLPGKELVSGFAEVIKSAAVYDAPFFEFLESSVEDALSLDVPALERTVYDSLTVKSAIVSRDERESGERRKLNFGHTVGHAIEKVYQLRHGEAVSLGMMAAGRLSVSRGLLDPRDLKRVEGLLVRVGLPVRMALDNELIADALAKDKKRESDSIHFVLLDAIGSACVVPIELDELKEAINDMREPG